MPVGWPRRVDFDLFKPATSAKGTGSKKNPIFINVGRVAVEKNIEAFLDLDLPGEKWFVGGGPDLARESSLSGHTIFWAKRDGRASRNI